MVNYGNSKIYKIEPIVEHEEGEIYVGSTTKQYLSQRMVKHRNCYKLWKDGKAGKVTVYDIFDKYGIDNCKIYLLESVIAISKDELLAREGYYIKTLKCINRKIEGRTPKEYRKDNIDKINERNKQYRKDNIDKLTELNKHYRENNKENIKNYLVQYRSNLYLRHMQL